ncbi:hypothetical protein, partial [Streptomyces yangpuensis]
MTVTSGNEGAFAMAGCGSSRRTFITGTGAAALSAQALTALTAPAAAAATGSAPAAPPAPP